MLSMIEEKCDLGTVEHKKQDFQFYLLIQGKFQIEIYPWGVS